MGKEYKGNGVIVVTREAKVPDSERQVTRDDCLFPLLRPVFSGEQLDLDFDAIAAQNNVNPEDIFTNLHENYGYVCIGTGENTALGEKLSADEKRHRQKSIEDALAKANIPHIKIRGKYMGTEEISYFTPFNDQTIGLPSVLKGDIVSKLTEIATTHRQDSLLIVQKGEACYKYTFGPQKGNVIVGTSAVVYPRQELLPDDCFSLFLNAKGNGSIGFTCALNFDHVYASDEEYAAEVNKTRREYYEEFITEPVPEAIRCTHFIAPKAIPHTEAQIFASHVA